MDPKNHRTPEFSPLFIGLLGVIAGAIMVATYHCAVGCNHRRETLNETNQRRRSLPPTNNNNISQETTRSTSSSTAQLIPLYRFTQDCKEGVCSICLCEFKEGEKIRVLPECSHLFHMACIDMWLYSHPNCPLCRADTTTPPQDVAVSFPDSGGVPPPEFWSSPDFGGWISVLRCKFVLCFSLEDKKCFG